MHNVTQSTEARQPLNDRVLATGVIRRTPAVPVPTTPDAIDLIRQHAAQLSSHNGGLASDVCETLGVDVDEGRYVSWHDAATLALTLYAIASDLADRLAVRALVSEIPPQSLREALEEVQRHTRTISPERYDDLADDARDMEREDFAERGIR